MAKAGRGGKFGRADAGTPHELTTQTWGTKREAEKSQYRLFNFVDSFGNTRSISAKSFEEALQQAKVLGLTLKRKR